MKRTNKLSFRDIAHTIFDVCVWLFFGMLLTAVACLAFLAIAMVLRG